MRTIEFQGVENVRDLGGIPVGDGRIVKPGLFFRGAMLAKATQGDAHRLETELGIRRVIDLRVGWEREAKPDVALEGAENLWLPFFDNEVVGIEYVKPIPGTRMKGHDFACDPDDFYRSMVNPLTVDQMRKVIGALTQSALEGSPAYYHCSGGKDRAGISTVLLLSVLGANRQDILEDYLLTNISRDAHIQETYERFLYLCYNDEDMARRVTDNHRARPENLISFYSALDESYGGMDEFIRNQLGIDDNERNRLREALTEAI